VSKCLINHEISRLTMIAPDSQMVRSVLGSWMAGSRPFGLCLVYSGPLISERATSICSKGILSSLRIIYTFPGFGPRAEPQKVIGLVVEVMLVNGDLLQRHDLTWKFA
jgi:hypothetical protein